MSTPAPVTSVHLGESADEVEFLEARHRQLQGAPARNSVCGRRTGSRRAVRPWAICSDLGFLDRCALVVHGVQFDGGDLSRLAALGTTVASCPRSNVHVGVGSPPLEAFYAMDVNVAFGTDSLASVADLESVFRAEGGASHCPARAGPPAARERDSDRGARARFWRRLREHRRRQARRAHRRPHPGWRGRCGRIPGRWNRARAIAWLDVELRCEWRVRDCLGLELVPRYHAAS